MSGFRTIGTVEIVREALVREFPMISPAMSAASLLREIYNPELVPFLDSQALRELNTIISTPDIIECLTILEGGYNR